MKKIFLCLILLAGLLCLTAPAQAAVISIEYNFQFSDDGSDPAGSIPWLIATLEDAGDNTVKFTLTAGGLINTEFVSNWYFNLNDSFNDLMNDEYFTFSDPDPAESIELIELGSNSFTADGGGDFDIKISFPIPNNTGDLRFGSEDSTTFTIEFKPPTDYDGSDFNAASFIADSVKGGPDPTVWPTAAHIQSIDSDFSGWVTGDIAIEPSSIVPEPATVFLLGAGLIGLAAYGRRKFRK